MSQVITPTVGRIVYFKFDTEPDTKHQAAIITQVHHERMVDVTRFPAGLPPVWEESIPLAQPDDLIPKFTGKHCFWMPYQVKNSEQQESNQMRPALKKLRADQCEDYRRKFVNIYARLVSAQMAGLQRAIGLSDSELNDVSNLIQFLKMLRDEFTE